MYMLAYMIVVLVVVIWRECDVFNRWSLELDWFVNDLAMLTVRQEGRHGDIPEGRHFDMQPG